MKIDFLSVIINEFGSCLVFNFMLIFVVIFTDYFCIGLLEDKLVMEKIKAKSNRLKYLINKNETIKRVKSKFNKGVLSKVGYFLFHSKISNIAFIGLFLVGLYLVIYPFVPALKYKLFYENKEHDISDFVEYAGGEDGTGEGEFVTDENRIIIPKIGVDMPIVEGQTDKALDLGVWHRPGTGSPGSGNMVLTGHRVGYAFLPEDVKASTSFYNLDKLKNGDEIYIFWNNNQYVYKVTGNEVVEPFAVYVEEPTEDERLTLYTCHPLGSNSQRLVYYAEPSDTQAYE